MPGNILSFFNSLIIVIYILPNWALAEGITESNYLHINPKQAIVANGQFFPNSFKEITHTFNGLKIVEKLAFGRDSETKFTKKQRLRAIVNILFDEAICVFGAKVTLDNHGVRHGVEIVFSFVSHDGTQIDEKVRWPANGTTLQSFSSDRFTSRFAQVEITAPLDSGFMIRDVLALPCSFAIS